MLPIRSVPLLFVTVLFSALLLQLFLPWWIVVVIGFAAGLASSMPSWQKGLTVFAAIGLLWLGAALFITVTESAVLLPRIAALLQLPSTWMVFGVTVLIGAVPSSLAAVGASWLIIR
jgi:hypothetical protein